jgi:hypothetical protein
MSIAPFPWGTIPQRKDFDMAQYARVLPETIRTRIMQIGVTSVIFAIGFAMTGYVSFWRGIFLMSAIIAFYLGNLWYFEKKMATREKGWLTLALVVSYAVLLWFVFIAAPLNVFFEFPPANFPADRVFFGVKWRSEFYPINVVLINKNDISYDGFDSYIKTNALIAKIGIKDSINHCVPSSENPGPSADVMVEFAQTDGTHVVIPLNQEDQTQATTFFRVRCDKVAANSKIELVVATVQGPPKWVAMQTSYMAAGRSRSPFFSSCLTKTPCSDIPKSF